MEIRITEAYPKPAPRRRKKRQRLRIQSHFKSLLESMSDLVVLGKDPLFQTLLEMTGKQPPTVVAYQVVAAGVPLTVVAVPDRIWVNPKAMASIVSVKKRMLAMQRDCILFPQGAIGADHHDAEGLRDLFRCNPGTNIYGCSPSNPAACISHVAAKKTCSQQLQ